MINELTSKTIIVFFVYVFNFFEYFTLLYKYSELDLYSSVDLDFINSSKIKGDVNSIYILKLVSYIKIKSI